MARDPDSRYGQSEPLGRSALYTHDDLRKETVMKHAPISTKRGLILVAIGLIIVMMLQSSLAYAEPGSDRDEEVRKLAQTAYESGEWLDAARYLTAYIEREPHAMKDKNYQEQITKLLTYSIDKVNGKKINLEREVDRWRNGWYEVATQCTKACPQVSPTPPAGFSLFEPLPPPFVSPPSSTSRSYPLVCRGGEDISISYKSASQLSNKPHFVIEFRKAGFKVGRGGENLPWLEPGQCTWIDRRVGTKEPNAILLKYPLIQPDGFSISWSSQGNVQVNDAQEILSTLVAAEPGYEAYHVYNDGAGHFVVTGRGVVIGLLKVDSMSKYAIGHENLDGLKVDATVYTDRPFKYTRVPPELVGLPYIKTANKDKKLVGEDDTFLSFQMNRAADVYVAHDDRYMPKTSWLQDFEDTNQELVFNDGLRSVHLSLYKKHFPAGEVALGNNVRSTETGDHAMYTVVIKYAGHLEDSPDTDSGGGTWQPKPTFTVPTPIKKGESWQPKPTLTVSTPVINDMP
jgi:hypothetical protein